MYPLIPLTVLFPLLGFLFNGLAGSRIRSEKVIGWIGSGTVGVAFALGVVTFVKMLSLPVHLRAQTVELFRWISSGTGTPGSLNIPFSLLVDQLSIVMVLIVTGVGFLIHVYSIGYMHGDPGFWRFFSYMNLFIVAMLILVLADNFVVLFLGWEGVGLCSYLLIGFWYDRPFEKSTTSDAAKKAFIVNRIGDFGFLLGLFLIFATFGTLTFRPVFHQAEAFLPGDLRIFWITLLLFLGAVGKSAQIPLYVWLPDAMAGPTPVSALIHAATMVTAGVYMVSRTSVLYALAPTTMMIVAIVGAVTALYAASIGLVQNDIKKILAYSTISQLGYMFLAAGVGAFAAGIFHLMTHAFFKALLFLGAGAVIHSLHGEQNIQRMGGLKRYLPTTYWTFLVAALAISGIPPLSGFFSKDEILTKAFFNGSFWLWLIGFVTAGMTAFYIFRLFSLTFEGTRRFSDSVHPHEAPLSMTIPLIILAVLSISAGWVGISPGLGVHLWRLEQWLAPVFEPASNVLLLVHEEANGIEYVLMALTFFLVAGSIYVAYTIYVHRKEIALQLGQRFSVLYKILFNKYYVDEAYDAAIVKPLVHGSQKLLWKWFDVGIVDGTVNGIAKVVNVLGAVTRRVQTGIAQSYAVVFILGLLFALWWLLFS